ncbi:hypothetical protein RZS08_35560, partial [Arthrospira platensis SPKY1]|nr:hypothetical protein [Arthrospira platensis SPKY1]
MNSSLASLAMGFYPAGGCLSGQPAAHAEHDGGGGGAQGVQEGGVAARPRLVAEHAGRPAVGDQPRRVVVLQPVLPVRRRGER